MEKLADVIQANLKEGEEPTIVSREEFLMGCTNAYDVLMAQQKETDNGIDSILNMIGRANMYEINPDFRVIHLRMPNGMLAMNAIPKEEFGYKYERNKDK